jgi:hypothetical protein
MVTKVLDELTAFILRVDNLKAERIDISEEVIEPEDRKQSFARKRQ